MRNSLTIGADARKSFIVKGGGMTKALKVESGGVSGSGIDARNAFLASIDSFGSSVSGEVYFRQFGETHDTWMPSERPPASVF